MFSAIQDIAVDGLALEVLRDEHLGLGNTIQVEQFCEKAFLLDELELYFVM